MTAPNLSGLIRSTLGRDRVRGLGKGTNRGKAGAAAKDLERLGISAVGVHSPDEEIEQWEDLVWNDQKDLVEDRAKEWTLNLYYCANEQFLAYHAGRRSWIRRPVLPNRIRSNHNVCASAVNVRVTRLTENKPTVSVQAANPSRANIERAEYKESLFWVLWDKLSLKEKIVRARRWSAKTGSGFLKTGWDPEAGCEYPATIKRPKYEEIQAPATGPDGQPLIDDSTQQPVVQPQRVYVGIEELYLDADGKPIGPVEVLEDDPTTGTKKRIRQPVPDNCNTYFDGEAFVDVRTPFNIRWDRYADDIADSWYVQDGDILSTSRILALYPDAKDKLEDAKPATDDDRFIQWRGLMPRQISADGVRSMADRTGGDPSTVVERDYMVRETWIYPVNPLIRKLWGKNGALLVTVGGRLVMKTELPAWARKHKNFVQLYDMPEEGNHYHKPPLRDLIPLQDDINRTRSMKAERQAILSRLLLWAPQNHGMNMRALAGMAGVMVTTRTKEHKPEPLALANGDDGSSEFLQLSLAAARDVGSINDASTGKLPAVGTPAKAIYALQYADERSISEASNQQDVALQRLARSLDEITKTEYKEARKISIVGEDRSFMVAQDVLPEHLDTEVDYFFTPGSMLSRQKEAVKNELLTLYGEKLIDAQTVMKNFPTAVPDAFRRAYNLQEAKARRQIDRVLRGEAEQIQPDPFDNPEVQLGVVEEFLLTRKFEILGQKERDAILHFWQMLGAQLQLKQQREAAAQSGTPTAPPPAKPGGQPLPGPRAAKSRKPADAPTAQVRGANALEHRATQAMEQHEPAGGEAPI